MILILGVALPPLLRLFQEVTRASTDGLQEQAASQLASSLMEEVVSKAFADPESTAASFGPEESVRTAFDDVDDFHGFVDSPPSSVTGTALVGFEGLARRVSVFNVRPTVPVVSGSVTSVGGGPTPVVGGTSNPNLVPVPTDGFEPAPMITGLKRILVEVYPSNSAGTAADVLARLQTLRSEVGGEPAEPDLEYPSIDPYIVERFVQRVDNRTLRVAIYNPGPDDIELEAFQFVSDIPGQRLREINKDGEQIWRGDVRTPTGIQQFNRGSAADRTLRALDWEWFELEHRNNQTGQVLFFMELFGTNGEFAESQFFIVWT